MATVRWTCFNHVTGEYCQREHKSKEAAQKCARRVNRLEKSPEDWKTLEVTKGFYARGEHLKCQDVT